MTFPSSETLENRLDLWIGLMIFQLPSTSVRVWKTKQLSYEEETALENLLMEHRRHIRSLTVNVYFSQKIIRALAAVLKNEDCSVEVLDLSFHSELCSDERLKSVIDALEYNSSVRTIDFAHCSQLSSKTVASIADAICDGHNMNLQHVQLTGTAYWREEEEAECSHLNLQKLQSKPEGSKLDFSLALNRIGRGWLRDGNISNGTAAKESIGASSCCPCNHRQPVARGDERITYLVEILARQTISNDRLSLGIVYYYLRETLPLWHGGNAMKKSSGS